MNPYDSSSAAGNSDAAGANNAAAMAGMDPAWAAYYQSMNYYNMMQSNMAGGASSAAATSTTTTKPTDSTASTSDTSSTTAGTRTFAALTSLHAFVAASNPAAGQADYSQQWIEYYRSMGQNEYADEIARQMKQVFTRRSMCAAARDRTDSFTLQTSSPAAPSAAEPAQAPAMTMPPGNANASSWAAYAQQWANAAMANAANGNSASSAPTS